MHRNQLCHWNFNNNLKKIYILYEYEKYKNDIKKIVYILQKKLCTLNNIMDVGVSYVNVGTILRTQILIHRLFRIESGVFDPVESRSGDLHFVAIFL